MRGDYVRPSLHLSVCLPVIKFRRLNSLSDLHGVRCGSVLHKGAKPARIS